MTAEAGDDFTGLDRMEARQAVVEELTGQGLLLKTEDYVHNVGYSQRSHVPIEPYLSEQWFLKYPSVETSAKAVEEGSISFDPDRWTKTYAHWMQNLRDWCISRQLWWGHRVPVWYKTQAAGDANSDETFTRCQIESPGEGWTQDPDVLDTWFSSWLWPFAAMGWPEQTETLKKFYPTTDLVTGPDILFFWVARMIMAGYEFMGEMPFRNVYFTGIIRDKLGRKMSKSLGNSPDPLELIAKFGADALRFGTMRSAPLGQDVLFDEKDVELGRNFCNKLWNACRFRQMQGGQVQGEIEPGLLTSDDKWILLKLDQAIGEITNAFAQYRLNEASQTLYRFFWSEYCDWYVEASKAVLSRPAGAPGPQSSGLDAAPTPSTSNAPISEARRRRANTLAVMDFILSHALRLFHPFLPFITEELWHGMGYHEEMPENQGGRTIMYAPWPKPLGEDFRGHYGLDAACLAAVNAKYDLVTQGRNLRREANLPAGKKVKFVFKPAQPLSPLEADVLKLLLNAEALEINPASQPPKGTPAVHSVLGDLYLPLEGQVDAAAEQARLTKELEKIEGEIAKAWQKLDNPNFTAKAPPHVLQEHRQRLAEWQAKRQRVIAALEALKT
jgi:valyl-tRNA synthetase